jgi:CheY-like chemotaxis protein
MSGTGQQKTILLAEDDVDDRELFLDALAGIDVACDLHSAENGREALVLLDGMKIKPDLIFLDINMPQMNGWECLTTLKASADYGHIPVIIYSSSSHQREHQIASDLGAAHFFTKPDDFRVFRQQLKDILERF